MCGNRKYVVTRTDSAAVLLFFHRLRQSYAAARGALLLQRCAFCGGFVVWSRRF